MSSPEQAGTRPTERERLAYIAGFVDGEGCVRWNRGPCLEITNTHREALEEIQAFIGGTVGNSNRNTSGALERVCHRLTLYGDKAEAALREILPWLCIKRTQAATILKLAKARREKTMTPEIMAEGLEFLKIEKAVAFDTRSDDEV